MAHAVVRTNETGIPFRGRCIKCGAEDLPIGAGCQPCPQDDLESDADALIHILDARNEELS